MLLTRQNPGLAKGIYSQPCMKQAGSAGPELQHSGDRVSGSQVSRSCSALQWVQGQLSTRGPVSKENKKFCCVIAVVKLRLSFRFYGVLLSKSNLQRETAIDKKKKESKISRLSTSNGNSRPSRWCMSTRQEFLKVKGGCYKAQWFSTRGLEAGVGGLQQRFDGLALQKTFMFMTITVAKAQWWNTMKNMYLESPQHEELW